MEHSSLWHLGPIHSLGSLRPIKLIAVADIISALVKHQSLPEHSAAGIVLGYYTFYAPALRRLQPPAPPTSCPRLLHLQCGLPLSKLCSGCSPPWNFESYQITGMSAVLIPRVNRLSPLPISHSPFGLQSNQISHKSYFNCCSFAIELEWKRLSIIIDH